MKPSQLDTSDCNIVSTSCLPKPEQKPVAFVQAETPSKQPKRVKNSAKENKVELLKRAFKKNPIQCGISDSHLKIKQALLSPVSAKLSPLNSPKQIPQHSHKKSQPSFVMSSSKKPGHLRKLSSNQLILAELTNKLFP